MKIAAYCRVSTDREDQANSFESQMRYYREYIERTPGWELYQIYADEGMSGTSTKRRIAFKKMIADSKAGKFELILTKEISRFARNTLDSIFYTRQLRSYGVGVFFVNDNINTRDSDAELRLTILSSIAQEESRRTSERVKWGQKRRMEQGVVFGRSMLGYDVQHGAITINEDGAYVVRRIYHKFLEEGKGTYVIARELKEEGFLPMNANEWNSSVIYRILRNEKYCGDLVQKKTYTPDFLTHEKRYNQGEEALVVIKNHHKAIIKREQFDKVQKVLDCRSKQQEMRTKYSNRYFFSSKVYCETCGKPYTARLRKRADGSDYLVWRCDHDEKVKAECKCIHQSIKNEELQQILLCMNQELPLNREYLMQYLTDLILRSRIALMNQDKELDHVMICNSNPPVRKCEPTSKLDVAIQDEKKRLLKIYMKGYISEEEFLAARREWRDRERLNMEQKEGGDKGKMGELEMRGEIGLGRETKEREMREEKVLGGEMKEQEMVEKGGLEGALIKQEILKQEAIRQENMSQEISKKIEMLIYSNQFDEDFYRPFVKRVIRVNKTSYKVVLYKTSLVLEGSVGST